MYILIPEGFLIMINQPRRYAEKFALLASMAVALTTYSWLPTVLLFVIFLPLVIVMVLYTPISIQSFLLYSAILFGASSLRVYLNVNELVRSATLIGLIPFFYYLGRYCPTDRFYKKIIIYCGYICVMLCLYYVGRMMTIDSALSTLQRASYRAQEFFLFGEFYDFTFGVTHLNMYATFCFLGCAVAYYDKSKVWILAIIPIIAYIYISQSRGPVLFLFLLVFCMYLFSRIAKKQSFSPIFFYTTLLGFIVLLSAASFWAYFKSAGYSVDNRLLTSAVTDLSRLTYFQLGIDHLRASPFGNVAIYSSGEDLNNYHNTFLAFGNRYGIISGLLLVGACIGAGLKALELIKSGAHDHVAKISLLALVYCLFFMSIEDVTRFDRFVFCMLIFQIGFIERMSKNA